MSTITHPRITPEELLKLPDGERCELVNGELIESHMGIRAVWITAFLIMRLGGFIHPRRLGHFFSEHLGYRCFSDPDKIRKPDFSFVAAMRFTDSHFEEGYCLIAPDLAVEVVSPNDLFNEVEQKAEEYLEAGVRLVWVINPEIRIVDVFRADGTTTRLRGTQALSGEDVIPEFSCPINELFDDMPDIRQR